MNLRLTLLLLSAAILFAPPLASPAKTATPDASTAIEYLLAYVESTDLVFVRNGKDHTPAEAVDHMRRKYEYYEKKIDTAEDFIALAASKSMMSGKPYTVRINDGEDYREMLAAEWLTAVLGDYRQASRAGESP